MQSLLVMPSNPVSLAVQRASSMARIHVLIRLALLVALGIVGCSSVYWLLYLALPALVALFVSQIGSERYLAKNSPAIVSVLELLADIYAYLWLLTDRFPTSGRTDSVVLHVEPSGHPTTATALLRTLGSLPALLLFTILSIAAALLWPLGAISILIRGRVPTAFADFFTFVLRYQFRLIAYHLSLVERYPSLEETDAFAVGDA